MLGLGVVKSAAGGECPQCDALELGTPCAIGPQAGQLPGAAAYYT